MKTLDEVINELEYEAKYNAGDWCELDSDALHYLKEYRDCGQCSYADSYLRCTQENSNAPLTWEQLKQMEGKPVWIEYDDHDKGRKRTYFKIWDVVDFLSGGDMCMVSKWTFQKDDLGKTWQAYRKER